MVPNPFGFDWGQFKALVWAKWMQSHRSLTAPFVSKDSRGKGIQWATTLALLGVLGTLICVWPIFLFDSPFTALTAVYALTAWFTALFLFFLVPTTFMDSSDLSLTVPMPVSEYTLFLARLTHLGGLVGFLVGGLISPVLLAGMIRYHILFAIPALMMTSILVLLVTSLYCGVTLIGMRLLGKKWFGRGLVFGQAILIVAPVFLLTLGLEKFMQTTSLEQLRTAHLETCVWVYLFPPAWMAAPLDLIFGKGGREALLLSILALLLPLICLILIVRSLSATFALHLKGLGEGANDGVQPATPSRAIRLLSRCLLRDPEEEAFFNVLHSVTGRDSQFKADASSSILALGTFLLIPFWIDALQLKTPILTQELAFYSLHLLSLSGAFCLLRLSTSESFQASWIFFSLPISSPSPILRASIKWVSIRFLAPLFAVATALFVALWGPMALAHGLYTFCESLFLLTVYGRIFCKRLPLAEKLDRNILYRLLLIMAVFPVVSLLCSRLHEWMGERPQALLGGMVTCVLATFLVMRSYRSITWDEMKSQYGLFPSELHKSVWDAVFLLLATLIVTGLITLPVLFLLPPLWAMAVGTMLLPWPLLWFIRRQRLPLREALRLRSVHPWILFLACLLGISSQGVFSLTEKVTSPWTTRLLGENPFPGLIAELLPDNLAMLPLVLLSLSILPGICEEVLFRGGLQGLLERKGVWKGIFLTSLIFSLCHGNPWHFLELTIAGILLGVVVFRTGSILPAMLLHASSNAAAVLSFYFLPEVPPLGISLCLCGVAAVCLGLFWKKTRVETYTPSPLLNAPKFAWKRPLLITGACLVFLLIVLQFGVGPLFMSGWWVTTHDMEPLAEQGDGVIVLMNRVFPVDVEPGDIVAFKATRSRLGRLKWVGTDAAVILSHGKNHWVQERDIQGRAAYRVSTRLANEQFGFIRLSQDQDEASMDETVLLVPMDGTEKSRYEHLEGTFYQAEESWKKEDWEKALAGYALVTQQNPEHWEAWYWKGQCLGRLKRFQEERRCYERIVLDATSDPKAGLIRANALFMLGEIQQSLKQFDEFMRRFPEDPEGYYGKAVALSHLHLDREALDLTNQALERDPKLIKALRGKISALGALGLDQEKLDCYEKLLALDPTSARDWYYRGNICYRLRRYREALVYYEKSLETDPQEKDVWYWKGKTLLFLGGYPQAKTCFDQASDLGHKEAASLARMLDFAP